MPQSDSAILASLTASLVKLTQVYGFETRKERPIWINPSQITWMIGDDGGAVIDLVGNEHSIRVTEAPDDIVWLIEQARP